MKMFKGLKYSKEHEWVRQEGNRAFIGITNHAQLALGDIVYIELPAIGKTLKSGDALGVIESVKAASDVYTPVSGVVAENNSLLTDRPEMINAEPYESWIAVIELSDASEPDGLMDEEQYAQFCLKGE